jgi:cbb3-type cytochrome oxidase maturation protein
MYYPYFITYMVLGLSISLVVFLWALKNGQFKDQQRARFLPLQGEPSKTAGKASKLNRYEGYALLFLAAAGLAAIVAVLVFALYS